MRTVSLICCGLLGVTLWVLVVCGVEWVWTPDGRLITFSPVVWVCYLVAVLLLGIVITSEIT